MGDDRNAWVIGHRRNERDEGASDLTDGSAEAEAGDGTSVRVQAQAQVQATTWTWTCASRRVVVDQTLEAAFLPNLLVDRPFQTRLA